MRGAYATALGRASTPGSRSQAPCGDPADGRARPAAGRTRRRSGDLERELHAARGVRIALDGVRALLERDRDLLGTDERHGGHDVLDAWPEDVEVVRARLVLHRDRVRTRLERLHGLARLHECDREAG